MAKSNQSTTKKPAPKHASKKLTRKERKQAWNSMSRGSEHHDR